MGLQKKKKCETRGKGNLYPKKEGMGLKKERKCEPRGKGNVYPRNMYPKKGEWDSIMKGNVTPAGLGMCLQNRGNMVGH
jgi:hypothetical protein